MPALIQLAERFPPSQRDAPLVLAAAIAARLTEELIPEDLAQAVRNSAQRGRSLAVAGLSQPGLPEEQAVNLLQSIASFGGDALNGPWLDAIAAGELELECPHCDAFLWVDPRPENPLVASEQSTTTVLRPPSLPLPNEAAELRELARHSGHVRIASAIELIYGDATCPACGRDFAPAQERVRQDR